MYNNIDKNRSRGNAESTCLNLLNIHKQPATKYFKTSGLIFVGV